ncbi:MAG: TIGR01777 family oxidoreductase, partial [Actinomycetota bacterium]
MARIVVAGGSGFIGSHLIPTLLFRGDEVIVFTRSDQHRPDRPAPQLRHVRWDPAAPGPEVIEALTGADAVINLAGVNIGSRRWTRKRKAALIDSRVRTTEAIVGAIAGLALAARPRVLVNASGIDYYGDRGEEKVSETSSAGDSFLAQLCVRWERAALEAEGSGVRLVLMRTSVVLAPDAITLKLMALPFRFFLGGPLGNGKQRFTWIHIDDLTALYRLAIDDERLSGPVNAAAPDVPAQAEVARELGKVLHRPSRLRAPAFALRLALGEQADLLLHGRVAVPEVATKLGFSFLYPTLDGALRACLGRDRPRS